MDLMNRQDRRALNRSRPIYRPRRPSYMLTRQREMRHCDVIFPHTILIGMGYPRSHTVIAGEPGFYHCHSRCVRRSWLCGNDPVTGKNFDHRRTWIEQRLLDLANSFAVALYAWAVMDNHCHVILAVDPRLPRQWSDEDVASRWSRLCASHRKGFPDPESRSRQQREAELLGNPERLETIRQRLGCVSWFNRYLKEAIAREANAEDGCSGHFWDSRFGCQVLLDERAILTCMAYVDLNPIRAGAAISLADSRFTSIQHRLEALGENAIDPDEQLGPVAGSAGIPGPEITLRSYIELVDWTGRQHREGKRGAIDSDSPHVLARLRAPPDTWVTLTTNLFSYFRVAVGSRSRLNTFARRLSRSRIRGMRVAW
ncbi:MAG: transposase [Pseudomonadales bacterium]|nr:transposase [Pseudomonadales bacterium]